MTDTAPSNDQSDSEDPVLAQMLAEEVGESAVARTSLTLGLVLTLFLCAVVALVVTLLFYIWFETSGLGLAMWTVVMVAISMGICWFIDNQTKGRRYADAQIAGPVFHPIGDKLLLPFRMLVGGMQRKRRERASEDQIVIERGSRLIYVLGGKDGPTLPAHLIEPGDTPDSLDRVIDHLTVRDWVGHSSDRQKIWLSSRAKDTLARLGLLTQV
jgi:hypothetical protein